MKKEKCLVEIAQKKCKCSECKKKRELIDKTIESWVRANCLVEVMKVLYGSIKDE
jgi:hypothetical protein